MSYSLSDRIELFKTLSYRLQSLTEQNSDVNSEFEKCVADAAAFNPWFTRESVLFAVKSIVNSLSGNNLEKWLDAYHENNFGKARRVGVIMAGNIPLVGFHDMLSVLLSGNIFVGKLSSKDDLLLRFVSDLLIEINPDIKNYLTFSEQKLENIDAVIATGSDNSARYFEYYFGKYPHIIRKNRNSVAVLTGNESDEKLALLADDIFTYFGLGCRNVSKLFVPDNYDFRSFFEAMEKYNELYNHNKYFNNYEYNKAIYLMNKDQFLDNGFMILKESNEYSSPVSVVFYEMYNNLEIIKERFNFDKDKIQCIVSECNGFVTEVSFGNSQKPSLWDYADGVDTLQFLSNL